MKQYTSVSHVGLDHHAIDPDLQGAIAGAEGIFEGQGVAAGNIYDWVAYSTVRNNACISLTFILHSTNPANFPVPPPLFDKNAESAVFATTMNSFNWITP